jgi:hypothetical protein
MRIKKIIKILLLLFFINIIVVFPLFSQTKEVKVEKKINSIENKDYFIIYYFYTTYRCVSCRKIEKWSKEVIEEKFADELKTRKFKFIMKNMDDEKNSSFIQNYKLFTKSLVLVKYKNQKEESWKNLSKVWELLLNEEKFKKYIKNEIESFTK